jgi:hypothetical protein
VILPVLSTTKRMVMRWKNRVSHAIKGAASEVC